MVTPQQHGPVPLHAGKSSKTQPWVSVLSPVLEGEARDVADPDSLLRVFGHLAMVTVFVAVFICIGHGASESQHVLFWVIDVCVLAVPLGYVLLRCKRIVGPKSLQPVAIGFLWLLCLMTSLSAPSHRIKLLGNRQFEGETVACEEGFTALWIGLLLVAVHTNLVLPPQIFALFGSVIILQHLIVGLALPRTECSAAVVPRGGLGGACLGLPPLWISTLQLLALMVLLVMLKLQFQQRQPLHSAIQDFIDNQTPQHLSDLEQELGNDFLAQTRIERIIGELEKAEHECCDFVEELDNMLPRFALLPRLWAALARHLVNIMGHSLVDLKSSSTDGGRAQERLVRAILRGRHNTTRVDADTASWLEHSFMQPSADWPGRKKSKSTTGGGKGDIYVSSSPDLPLRHPMRIETVDGIRARMNITKWDFDAHATQESEDNVLQLVGFELLRDISFLPRVQLALFLEQLELAYVPENPYHSHVHAADVCNAYWVILNKTELWASTGMDSTLQMSCMIAALGHDVGHFARNNRFLIATRDALAMTYNDISVLENFHASSLMRLLNESYGTTPQDQTTLLSNLSCNSQQRARHLMITLILGTDPSRHLDDLSEFRVRLSSANFDPQNDASDLQQTLGLIIRAADIGHSAKIWDLHKAWSYRLVREFHEQGDEERKLGMPISPLCDRHDFNMCTSQVGFLQFICLPTWKELAILECCVRKLEEDEEVSTPRKRRPSVTSAKFSSEGKRSSVKNMHVATPRSRNIQQMEPASPRGLLQPKCLLSERSISGRSISSAASGRQGYVSEEFQQASWLAEVCMASCERNLEAWHELGQG